MIDNHLNYNIITSVEGGCIETFRVLPAARRIRRNARQRTLKTLYQHRKVDLLLNKLYAKY